MTASLNGPPVVETAPAKINLYLHVTGRRDDGYHLLDSMVAFAEIGDRLTLAPAPPGAGVRLSLTGPFAGNLLAPGPPDDNLVLRAVRAMAGFLKADLPDLDITLEKNLPVAAGLGGGSADAAAALRGLGRVWPPAAFDRGVLRQLAAALGADLPVCLEGQPAYLGGIGHDLTPAPPLPAGWLVLANPLVAVPTAAVYGAYGRQINDGGDFSRAARFAGTPGDIHELADLLRQRRNDLTSPALAVAPVIADVLAALDGVPHCLLSRLCGSGATCFGLFADRAVAANAAARLKGEYPHWWVEAAALLAPA